tara:strand:- start:120 stop:443 length:324 start_codon:yes stop_codon:yes gene_type:complete
MEQKQLITILLILFIIYIFIQNSNVCSTVNRNEIEEFGTLGETLSGSDGSAITLAGMGLGTGLGIFTTYKVAKFAAEAAKKAAKKADKKVYDIKQKLMLINNLKLKP